MGLVLLDDALGHRLTVGDVQRMAEAGVLSEDHGEVEDPAMLARA